MYGIPVRQLQAMMTSQDFAELLAYERCEGPVGPWRQDYLFATLRYQIAMLTRAMGRARGRPPRVDDYMPSWWSPAGSRRYPGRAAVQAKMEAWLSTHRASTGTG